MWCGNHLYVNICVILRLRNKCDYLSVLTVFVEVLIMQLVQQQLDSYDNKTTKIRQLRFYKKKNISP